MHVARIAQAIVGTVVVALIGLLAAQLAGAMVGLVTLGLAAVYVPLVTVGGAVMSEPLFAVFMLAALAAALQHRRSRHRYRYALLAGVLGGLAILTRANALVLLLPLAVAVWDVRPRLSRAALGPPLVLCVVALLTVTPWTVRNARVFHTFVPVSTQLGRRSQAPTTTPRAPTPRTRPRGGTLSRVPDYANLFNQVRRTPEPLLEQKLRAASLDYIATTRATSPRSPTGTPCAPSTSRDCAGRGRPPR